MMSNAFAAKMRDSKLFTIDSMPSRSPTSSAGKLAGFARIAGSIRLNASNATGRAVFSVTASSKPAAKPRHSPSATNAVDNRTACKGEYTRGMSVYKADSCSNKFSATAYTCSRKSTTS